MTIALKTVNYLDKEKEFIPWRASLTELGYVDSMLERTALYGPFSVRNFRISCSFVFTSHNIEYVEITQVFFAIRHFLNRQKRLTQSKQVTHFSHFRKFCDKARIHDKSLFTHVCIFLYFFFCLKFNCFFFRMNVRKKDEICYTHECN